MTKYFSKTTNGFYTPEIHSTMPSDVVEITDEYWQSLLDAQVTGKVIQGDENGNPILVDAPVVEIVPPTIEEKLNSIGLSIADLKTALGV